MMSARQTFNLVPLPSGGRLHALLRALSLISQSFGLVVRSTDVRLAPEAKSLLESLRPFLIEAHETREWPGTEVLGSEAPTRYTYDLNPVSLQILLDAAANLSDWVNPFLPEDLHFMRADGSTVLGTIAQENDGWLELDAPEYDQLAQHLGEDLQVELWNPDQ